MRSLNPEIDGVTGTEWNPLSTSDPDSNSIYFGDQSEDVVPDPAHSFDAILLEQVFGVPWTSDQFSSSSASQDLSPTLDGFTQNAERFQDWIVVKIMNGFKPMSSLPETVMHGYRPESLPVYKQLISEFAVYDRRFSSIPGLTQPNTLFISSATSYGAIDFFHNSGLKFVHYHLRRTWWIL